MFDYRRFYVLGEAFKRGALLVHALGEIPDPDALTRGETIVAEPIRFHHDQGSRLYDYIGTTWAVLDLLSDRVIGVLREHSFTGWDTYPVEVYNSSGHAIPGYHGFATKGRCGPIDDDLSPVMTVPPLVPEGKALPHRIGLRFRPETWDGTDVFSPEETTFTFVTEEVRNALVKAKATNIDLTRITEVEELVMGESEVQRDDRSEEQ